MSDNIKAASESEVARLHDLITSLHNKKALALLSVIKRAELLGDGADELIASLVDSRQLATMQKWVEYNGIKCSVADEEAETELSKRLKELKDKQSKKVVNLFDDNEDMATG